MPESRPTVFITFLPLHSACLLRANTQQVHNPCTWLQNPQEPGQTEGEHSPQTLLRLGYGEERDSLSLEDRHHTGGAQVTRSWA